jgi:hypothetical protein
MVQGGVKWSWVKVEKVVPQAKSEERGMERKKQESWK